MNLFYFTQIIPIVPKFEWNCFIYPNSIWGCWNLPKCFRYSPNFNEALIHYPIKMKQLEVTQSVMKLFHMAQTWMELLPLAVSSFSVLEFTLIPPIYGNISNFTQTWMKLF